MTLRKVDIYLSLNQELRAEVVFTRGAGGASCLVIFVGAQVRAIPISLPSLHNLLKSWRENLSAFLPLPLQPLLLLLAR